MHKGSLGSGTTTLETLLKKNKKKHIEALFEKLKWSISIKEGTTKHSNKHYIIIYRYKIIFKDKERTPIKLYKNIAELFWKDKADTLNIH